MKTKYFQIVLILILVSFPIYPQNKQSNWYPLSIGNYWEYEAMNALATNELHYSEQVVSDTFMDNSKIYYKIVVTDLYSPGNPVSGIKFLRIEANKLYQYDKYACENNESILYDFAAADSTYWGFCGSGDLGRGKKHNRQSVLPINGQYRDCQVFNSIMKFYDQIIWSPVGYKQNESLADEIGLVEYSMDGVGLVSLKKAIINGTAYTSITNVMSDEIKRKSLILEQNYPNPFNPSTDIKYSLPSNCIVSLIVYDALGREVKTLLNEQQNAGSYTKQFNGSELNSGIYFYVLRALNNVTTKKCILLK